MQIATLNVLASVYCKQERYPVLATSTEILQERI
jgi:hypothetical protein